MKTSKILLPEAKEPQQMNLFGATGVKETPKNIQSFPEIFQTRQGFERVVDAVNPQDGLGIDFEFKTYRKPSIMGIANTDMAAAIGCEPNILRSAIAWCLRNKIKLVGHSFLGAEKRVIKEYLGIDVPLELIDDSMVSHYLLNQDFCKSSGKEEDEAGSFGFMNLWVTASMVLDVPQWKSCRGRACEGPCPTHEVFGYCGVDAWASVAAVKEHRKQMREFGVPEQLYRELIELSSICDKMEQQGLRIDIPYIEKLNKEMEENKDKIFQYETFGKNKVYTEFNPRSSDQIIEWFKGAGIPLKTTDIKYISKILEKRGNKEGFGELKEYVEYLDGCEENLSSPIRELYKLYQFKSAGKGTDAWYSEKYRTEDFIHPRFIVTGTSTGRLASSRPNGANIPQRGWAVVKDEQGNEFNRIKAGIVPRDEGLDFVEADYSQMEFRGVLYFSGTNPKDIGEDAYTWLVQQDYESFRKAAASWPGLNPDKLKDVRYCGKTMALAANYWESFELYTADDLMRPHIKRQIANGAIRLYPKWEYCGGIVGFTGSNLAHRFFGNKSDENRKRALDIMEDAYFKAFPQVRTWQQKVSAEIESTGRVTSPTGRFLRLYGSPRDNFKVALAFLGQGCTGADHAQAVMLRYKRELGVIADLVVHDSMVLSIPKGWSDKQANEHMQIMREETWRLPGFACPIEVKRGPNYGQLRKLKI